jgi:general secretion pathway protein I
MDNRRRSRQAGFTLIEILIAFAILGMASAAVISIFGSDLSRVARAKNERVAALSARSVLALVGSELPLEPGTREGQLPNGLRWSLAIQPYEDAAIANDSNIPPVTTAYLVSVHTAAGLSSNSATADLISLRLKTENPQ